VSPAVAGKGFGIGWKAGPARQACRVWCPKDAIEVSFITVAMSISRIFAVHGSYKDGKWTG